jgi:hypothetical protein
VRADPARVYAPDPPPGKVRIVTVGDSFTHCDDVADTETWQRYLEGDNADLEVLNLGVPGYGSDQALLRWRRDGRRFRSQIVLLGIWPEDMCRNLNLVRYYLVPSEGFVTKPRMIPRDGELAVINSPVLGPDELVRTLTEPESHPLLRNDAWYRESETQPRLALESRAVRVAESLLSLEERKRLRARMYEGSDRAGIDMTVAIAEEFAREVRAAGSTPLVLLIPMRDLLALHTAREPFRSSERCAREGSTSSTSALASAARCSTAASSPCTSGADTTRPRATACWRDPRAGAPSVDRGREAMNPPIPSTSEPAVLPFPPGSREPHLPFEEAIRRLCEASRRKTIDPYAALDWPARLEPGQWFMSPELVSLHGTPFWEVLGERARQDLSFLEAVNFFSLNVHGRRR